MCRKEFIEGLKREISGLPEEEIEAAVEYYEEYFDEAGTENEEELLRRLGSPKNAARQIKAQYAVRSFDEDEKPSARKGISAVWYIIIGICSAPVSVPLAICMGALAIALLVTAICCIAALFAGIAAGALSGIAVLVIGVMSVPVTLSSALMLIGIGLTAAGIALLLGTLLFTGVKASVRAIAGKVRRKNDMRYSEGKHSGSWKKWHYVDEDKEEGEKK